MTGVALGSRRAGPVRATARRRPPARDLTLAVLVGLALLASFIVVQRAAVASYDGKIMLQVTENLLRRGSLRTWSDQFGFNTPYSTYGIGVSLLELPFMAVHVWLGGARGLWVTLANPVVLALVGAVIVGIGRDLGWSRRLAVCTALAFGLLTMAPWQSTEVFSEPGVTLGLMLAVWGCVRLSRHAWDAPWLVGGGVALAMLFRADSVLLVGVLVLFVPLLVPWRALASDRALLAGIAVPILISSAWIAFYNWLRYGSVTDAGYTGFGFTTPIARGLKLLLLQPGKGFFWYDPLLLCALPGLVLMWRRRGVLAVAITVTAATRVVFFAAWSYPAGGVAWGPRLLFPLCALLAIPAGEAWRWLGEQAPDVRSVGGIVVATLAAASAVLTVASVWVPYEQYWNQLATSAAGASGAPAQARIARSLPDSGSGHIWGNLSLLGSARPFPLEHFLHGPSAVGLAALLAALACAAGAISLAGRADRRAAARASRRRRVRARVSPSLAGG